MRRADTHTRVRYEAHEPGRPEWEGLLSRLFSAPDLQRVADVGGGASPAGSADDAGRDYEHWLIDISQPELDKAPDGFHKLCTDLTQPLPEDLPEFDLVVSSWVCEHIEDPAAFHRNVFELLRPGGRAAHFFPTLYAPPYLFNHLMPEGLTDWILHRVQDNREQDGAQGKFPALYRWCRGPSDRQLERLRSSGLEVEEYIGFFGHEYFAKVPPVDAAHRAVSRLLARHPVTALTTFSCVVLRRPLA